MSNIPSPYPNSTYGTLRRLPQAPHSFVPEYRPLVDNTEQTQDTRELRDVFLTLWHSKRAIFLLTMLGLLAGLIPGLLMTPVYRARTSLQLEGFNENYLNLRDITPVSSV